MAKLIRTGEVEAIDLKFLKSSDILFIEQEAEEMLMKNGGHAHFRLDLKGGIFHFIDVTFGRFLRKQVPMN